MNDAKSQYFDGEPESAPHRWILVVEDDPAIQEYYSQLLKGANYPFDLAKNGEWGWDRVQAKEYYLIVTDHDMPLLTGLGLIQRLDDRDYRIPVILISGTIPMDDRRLVGHCLFATIPKPVPAEVLLNSIAEVLALDLPLWFTHPFREKKKTVVEETSVLLAT
jgi:CheY-like chemotaxis protein